LRAMVYQLTMVRIMGGSRVSDKVKWSKAELLPWNEGAGYK
jgi:hypothetical protein